jgi:hypothetical protein
VVALLTREWQGPYLVTKRLNDTVYRIQLKQQSKPKVVHRNRLWKYTGETPPTWLSESPPTPRNAEEATAEGNQLDAPPELRRGRLRRQPDRLHY